MTITFTSCNNDAKKTSETEIEATETPVIIETIWVIDEHELGSTIPVTTAASADNKETEDEKANEKTENIEPIATEEAEEIEYEMLAAELIHEAITAETEPVEEDVAILAIPLEETETVKAYNKKGKDKGEIQVVSNAEGTINYIVFTKGKHKDVYDVETGLSGKEVRKLRREMKHMVKKGKVFLFSDSSNVMYLMDDATVNENGEILDEDVTIEEVEQMKVQAIIWKDKKNHKN
ncbi:MAG: hypothetical protein KAH07_01975 [Flavobacteriaceae bacterium]|nr:hypothetical protein [Flavobacteriaceae bacterium]